MEESTKEVVKKAALAVGSLKETEFDVRFNPDVFSPGVRHVNPTSDRFKKEKQLVKDAASFLVLTQIPSYVSVHRHICLKNYFSVSLNLNSSC